MQEPVDWWHIGLPRTKNFRVQKSARKVVASTFRYQDCIFLVDYLPKSQTLSTEYSLSLPMELKDILTEIFGAKFIKLVLYSHNNAPSHRALATLKKLAYLGFHCLGHPPFSPDLAPSDYHLFAGLKINRKVTTFLPTRRSLLPRRPG